ncbi:hypothetical protein FNF31_05103 [Cafeteria roenbergensis]|uniref:Uncharacterized protein n=3 Tax=Cafeteria roenbergensis TaxID=33653 RepID=A0A5A8D0I8_CAFRO|nr:hypothetical protein FNF31_05103 [Cafeteria roenbergensis]
MLRSRAGRAIRRRLPATAAASRLASSAPDGKRSKGKDSKANGDKKGSGGQSGSGKAGGGASLGTLSPDPSAEFRRHPFPAATRRWQVRKRVMERAFARVFDPSSVALLAGTTAAIFGIGVVEGCLIALDPLSPTGALFVSSYAAGNIVPSCLSATLDPRLVATALGLDHTAVLAPLWTDTVAKVVAEAGASGAAADAQPHHPWLADAHGGMRIMSPFGGGPEPAQPSALAGGRGGEGGGEAATAMSLAARTVLSAWLANTRSIAASFMLLAQVVRSVGIVATAGSSYRAAVRAGSEPMLGGVKERFVRLCGVSSDVTALSLAPRRCGEHIVPVFEDVDNTPSQAAVGAAAAAAAQAALAAMMAPPASKPASEEGGIGAMIASATAAVKGSAGEEREDSGSGSGSGAGPSSAPSRAPPPPAYRSGGVVSPAAADRARSRLVGAAHSQWPAYAAAAAEREKAQRLRAADRARTAARRASAAAAAERRSPGAKSAAAPAHAKGKAGKEAEGEEEAAAAAKEEVEDAEAEAAAKAAAEAEAKAAEARAADAKAAQAAAVNVDRPDVDRHGRARQHGSAIASLLGWGGFAAQDVADAEVPVFWRVGAEAYGETDAFAGLGPALHPSCLVKTSTGKRLLVIEADTTNPGEALALARRSSDLSLDDATLGFRQIEAVAKRTGGAKHAVRVLRVVLGDSLRPLTTGGGGKMTVRERIAFTGEADVVVDSRAPILLALLRWLGAVRQRIRLAAAEEAAAEAERAAVRAAEEAEAAAASDGDEDGAEDGPAVDDGADSSSGGDAEAQQGGKGASSADRRAKKAEAAAAAAKEAKRRKAEATAAALASRRRVRSPTAADVSVAGWLAEALEARDEAALAAAARREAAEQGEGDLLGADQDEVFGLGGWLQQALSQSAGYDAEGEGGEEPAGATDVIVDTGSAEYFVSLAAVLKEAGFRAVDAAQVPDREASRRYPRLVYHASTARSVAAALAMIKTKAVDPDLVCVIVDTAAGRRELREAVGGADDEADEQQEGDDGGRQGRGASGRGAAGPPGGGGGKDDSGLEVICAAALWDDLLRAVRTWAREGHTADDIQAELDRRFHRVLAGQQRLTGAHVDDDDAARERS